MNRRRVALLLIAFVTLAGLLVAWWAWPGKAPSEPHAKAMVVPTATAGDLSTNASGGDPWALLAAAQSAEGREPPDLPQVKPSMSEADWQAFDRQWCAALAPVRERLQGGASWLDLARLMLEDPERFELPKDQQDLMGELLAQRTERALLARDDVRSRAVALWAHSALSDSADAPPGAALLALAQSSRDPMVVALAAHTLRDPASALLAHPVARAGARQPGPAAAGAGRREAGPRCVVAARRPGRPPRDLPGRGDGAPARRGSAHPRGSG